MHPVVRLGQINPALTGLYCKLFLKQPNAELLRLGLPLAKWFVGSFHEQRCAAIDLGEIEPARVEFYLELFLVRPNVALIPLLKLPTVIRAGVRYQREPFGQEEFLPAPVIAQERNGDCEDLAGWLTADFRLRGKHAIEQVRPNQSGGYHAVTCLEGRIFDPSAALGMR